MPNKKITELDTATTPDGSELLEVVQSGTNKKLTAQEVADLAVTDEQSRAFSETLVFDKNEIEVAQHTMTGDITFVIDSGSSLVNESSSMLMEIVANGINSINFSSSLGATFAYIYPAGIQSGVILDAGTYEIYIYYLNGKARVNIPGVSVETSGLQQLAAPGNFTVTADGENALDLSWTDVANEVGYQIERSLTGTGGWSLFSNPATDATSDTETGLSPNTTVYYRIKAIGDGVSYADSPYATANGTTADGGDVTAPVPTFLPANGNSVWTVNRPATITLDEDIRDSDGVTAITSANAADYITLKQTNSGGADISKSVTYDAGTRTFTITPTTIYGVNQIVYLAISGIEDVNGNEMTLQSITFTTTEFTYLNGTSNRLGFGDILDSVIAANDTNFWIEITTTNTLLTGSRMLVTKYYSLDGFRSFAFYYNATNVYFNFWMPSGGLTAQRTVKWTGAMDSGAHVWVLKYDGSIDTNNGLDRCILLKDGATVGSKTLDSSTNSLAGALYDVTSQLAVGAAVSSAGAGQSFYTEELKDFKVRSSSGSVLEIDVPIIFTGTDVSGNARHGTWV